MTYKLPKGWKVVRLGDVIDSISIGIDRDREKVIPINTSDIFDGKVLHHEYKNIKDLPGQFKKTFKKGDVLFSEIRPINRRNAYIDFDSNDYVASTKLMVLRVKDKNLLSSFFYRYITSKKSLNYLQLLAETRSGTFPQIRFAELEDMIIYLPKLVEQKNIVDTLSLLDSKIENNNQMTKNLEEQAQAIFKHWFVDFEFPNEQGKPYKSSGGEMVESELGMIPKGWEVGKLGDSKLGKLMSSGIDKFRGEKIYLATADVTGTDIINNDTVVTMDSRPSRANMQPKNNTVWFAKMKDSRKLIFVEKNDNVLKDEYIFSTGFAGIQGSETSIYYLWTYIQSDNFDSIKNNLCTGTTMQAINNRNINRIKLVIPDSKILEKFNLIVKPLYKKIIVSRNENKQLEELRDALLPELMSGELRIPLD